MLMLPVTRRRPTGTPRTLPGLRDEIDRAFRSFAEGPLGDFGRFAPAADMFETDDAYVVEMELPGFGRDDIDVAVEEDALTVSGRREAETREDGNYHLRERSVGQFSRSFTLPASIDPDAVEARFDGGVLRVNLPKHEEARTRKIEVDVS